MFNWKTPIIQIDVHGGARIRSAIRREFGTGLEPKMKKKMEGTYGG